MTVPFDLAIINCGELLTVPDASKEAKYGNALSELGLISNAAVGISQGKIVWIGSQKAYRKSCMARREIDAEAKVVMPGLIDPHTHVVFAGRRDDEWVEKLKGKSYLEILESGGGILKTVDATRSASPESLFKNAEARLKKMLSTGTTSVEIKSGYGLNKKDELKILKVIRRLHKTSVLDVVATYLGAHAIPREFQNKRSAYVAQVISCIADLKSEAEFCDVFCEEGAFSYEETRCILEAAQDAGIKIKLHAGEFSDQNGPRLAHDFKAVSIDHLDVIKKEDIPVLAASGAIVVLLPGVSHFLGSVHHAPARALVEGGVPIALASDFNPGSCPCLSMQEIIHLAVLNLKMTVEEAICAATINAAHAINRAAELGSIELGKKADILLLDIDHYQHLPYFFGVNHVTAVIKQGKVVYG